MPRSFSIKLHSETQVSGRPEPIIGRGKEKALNNLPCPITPTLTASSVHHSSHKMTTTFLSYYNVT